MPYRPVIGLEIHVQLKTKTKMFCSCANLTDEAEPNISICPVCTGQPGALPVVNKEAIKMGLLAGQALNCELQENSKFDRKNYFYPDLPKGYQISQYDMPIALGGYLEIGIPKGVRDFAKIKITRIHLEEDAAKSFHDPETGETLVDYNRSSTPLVEIVTEPDFESPAETKIFLQELRTIMRYLDISDADMEKGQLRCDANISLQKIDDDGRPAYETLFPKTEIKNLNSFKAVERALEYEIKRQTKLWEKDEPPKIQSTRGWNDVKAVTEEQRTKEEEHDYRYFPEPDLPLLKLDAMIDESESFLPELPAAKRKRFYDEYGLSHEAIKFLCADPAWAEYTEDVISELKSWLESLPDMEGTADEIYEQNKKKLAKLIGGWLSSKLQGILADKNLTIKDLKIDPENFAEFITLIYTNKINSATAQKILAIMVETGKDPSHIMEDEELGQMDDVKEIEDIINNVIKNNPEQAEAYRNGKYTLIQYFVGMVMKETEGKADPNVTKVLLEKFLQK